jgi:hypothetical protein
LGGGLAGGKIRAGKLSAGGEKGFSRQPFSQPALSSPALIFPPAKAVCHAGLHASRGSFMLAQSGQNTKSEISSPFLQHQVGFLKYQVHYTNIGSILKNLFYNDVVIFSTSDKNMV